MPSINPSPSQGLVIFAKNKEKVSEFYQQSLSLKVAESDKTHDLLVGSGQEVVVHAISKAYAESIAISTPPEPREESAMKPTFVVNDLEVVRAAAKATGGFLKPLKQAWRFRGFVVLDGWDPEGNIVQFKQVDASNEG
jgi:predicted enzyme related to lactoylglutathione lyase